MAKPWLAAMVTVSALSGALCAQGQDPNPEPPAPGQPVSIDGLWLGREVYVARPELSLGFMVIRQEGERFSAFAEGAWYQQGLTAHASRGVFDAESGTLTFQSGSKVMLPPIQTRPNTGAQWVELHDTQGFLLDENVILLFDRDAGVRAYLWRAKPTRDSVRVYEGGFGNPEGHMLLVLEHGGDQVTGTATWVQKARDLASCGGVARVEGTWAKEGAPGHLVLTPSEDARLTAPGGPPIEFTLRYDPDLQVVVASADAVAMAWWVVRR